PRARSVLPVAARQREHVARNVVERQQRHTPDLLRARKLLQAPHDLGAVLGRLLDDGERPPQPLVVRAPQQQLHAPDDDCQQIVQMMRGAAARRAARGGAPRTRFSCMAVRLAGAACAASYSRALSSAPAACCARPESRRTSRSSYSCRSCHATETTPTSASFEMTGTASTER